MSIRISLLLADDHVAIASAISVRLREWYDVLTPCNTIEQLENTLRQEGPRPEVVLLDVSFGDRSGIRELPNLLSLAPEVRFVMLSGHCEEVIVDGALRAGASGYVHKSCGFAEIRKAVDAAYEGRMVVLLEGGRERPQRAPGVRPSHPLSPGQKRVLRVLKKYDRVKAAGLLRCTVPALDASIARLREIYGLPPKEHIDWDTLEIE